LSTQKAEVLAHLLGIFVLVSPAGLEGNECFLDMVLTYNWVVISVRGELCSERPLDLRHLGDSGRKKTAIDKTRGATHCIASGSRHCAPLACTKKKPTPTHEAALYPQQSRIPCVPTSNPLIFGGEHSLWYRGTRVTSMPGVIVSREHL
jgi:hypothetical protein